MNKDDILLIQELLNNDLSQILDNDLKEKLNHLQTKINLIVEQINAQDKIQEVQTKLMEFDKPKKKK